MTTPLTLQDWEQRAAQLSFRSQAIIDGKAYQGNGDVLDIVNPASGQVLAQVASCNEADIDVAVQSARRAFKSGVWRNMPRVKRKEILQRLAQLIRENLDDIALLETLNMGKPISETTQFDIPESATAYAWYGELIDKQYDEIAPTDNNALATITRHPLGVVAAVVPWNFPLMMSSWKVAPALAAGNSVILKPADATPLTAIRLGELALEAGLPPGVLNIVPGTGPGAGQALGLHPDVDCLTFTGSTMTGKRFMQYSGQSNLKQIWLECGGKSPHIVFDDCPDVDKAALMAAVGIFNNQGEVCIAGSRLYVQRGIYESFKEKLIAHAKTMQPGNPLDPKTAMGAMVTQQHMGTVMSYIASGCEQATLLTGGQQVRTETGGYYIEPTIFEVPSQDVRIIREEIFGPVLAVTVFDTEEEVLHMANDHEFGLGAGLWTSNISRAHRMGRELEAGLVWVNCYFNGNIAMPFGGVKQSGFGRDKSIHAIDKYTSLKSTWIDLTV